MSKPTWYFPEVALEIGEDGARLEWIEVDYEDMTASWKMTFTNTEIYRGPVNHGRVTILGLSDEKIEDLLRKSVRETERMMRRQG